MRERAVFVTCLMVAILSGTVLFSEGAEGIASWLDILFLIASAICLALGVIFLARRLKRVGSELERDPDR